jgi:hypothetical protein
MGKLDPQTISAIRILMIAGGTWLGNHGYGNAKDFAAVSDPAVIEAIAGLGLALGGGIWSLVSRTRIGVLKTASKVLGDKGVIVTDPETAAQLPANVVPSLAQAAGKPGVSAH